MYTLKRSNKLRIDNETLSFTEIIDKLKEEFYEVINAINSYSSNKTIVNLEKVVGEVFDVIQICILILWQCNRIANDFDSPGLIERINREHEYKLISEREWISESKIEINVKD